MNLFDRFVIKLRNFSPIKLALFVLCIEFIQSVVFSFLFPGVKGLQVNSLFEKIMITIILAPIVETYLTQQLIIELALKWSKGKTIPALLLSAAAFGLMHYYALAYMCKTFLSGLLFGTLYITLRENKNKAFLYVALTHASFNLIVTVFNYIIALS